MLFRSVSPAEQTHQKTQAAAVDEIDLAKIHDDVAGVDEQIEQMLSQRVRVWPLHDPSAARDHSDLTDVAALQRERHDTLLTTSFRLQAQSPKPDYFVGTLAFNSSVQFSTTWICGTSGFPDCAAWVASIKPRKRWPSRLISNGR